MIALKSWARAPCSLLVKMILNLYTNVQFVNTIIENISALFIALSVCFCFHFFSISGTFGKFCTNQSLVVTSLVYCWLTNQGVVQDCPYPIDT